MKKNSNLAIVEYITNVVVLFFVYRIIIVHLGIEGLGMWSLLLSLFSITSLGNAGIASGTVKFIAEYKSEDDNQNLLNVLFNSVLIVLGFTFLIFGVIYIILELLPPNVISQSERKIIAPLVPIIALSYLIAIVGRIFLSVLDGLNLIYLRSIIGIISKCFFLAFVILLIEKHGLIGLTYANLIQFIVILIVAGYYCIRLLNVRLSNFGRLNRKIFKQILSYGLQFQLSSIFQMLMDPVTKFFLKDLGGIVSVGNFEVLYKVYIQIRQFIVVLVIVIVPQISKLNKISPKKLKPLFVKVSSDIFLMTLILFNIAFCFMPLFLSLLGVPYSEYLHFFSIIIYLGLIFNIIGVVPYYFNAGTGDLRGNTISSFILALTNVCLCLLFGYLLSLSAKGIVISWTISQLIANVYLSFSYYKKNNIPIFLSKDLVTFIMINIFYLISSAFINLLLDLNLFLVFGLNISLLIVLMILIYKTNLLAKRHMSNIRNLIYFG